MNEKRYDKLVITSIYVLRTAMILIAIAIPVVSTIDDSILNRLLTNPMVSPRSHYIFALAYSECILGYLLSMFINFREKEIFVLDNTIYLRRLGQLIIIRDFAYIPINIIANNSLSINFNFVAWIIGYILILLSNTIAQEISSTEKQMHTV